MQANQPALAPQWIARVHRTYACLAKAAGPRIQ